MNNSPTEPPQKARERMFRGKIYLISGLIAAAAPWGAGWALQEPGTHMITGPAAWVFLAITLAGTAWACIGIFGGLATICGGYSPWREYE